MELNSNIDHVNYALVRALGRTALVKIAREGGGAGSILTSGAVGAGLGGAIGAGAGGYSAGLKQMASATGKTVQELKAMTPAARKALIASKGAGKSIGTAAVKGLKGGGKAGLIAGGLGLAGLTALAG
jgi:hypothetical protein